MFLTITIECETFDSETGDDIIKVLETMLPYMADNVTIRVAEKEN